MTAKIAVMRKGLKCLFIKTTSSPPTLFNLLYTKRKNEGAKSKRHDKNEQEKPKRFSAFVVSEYSVIKRSIAGNFFGGNEILRKNQKVVDDKKESEN